MKLPISKTENIVVQEANKELLIYDLITNQAFCLNETSAIIYLACDGKTTIEELKCQTNFSDDLIFLALDELQKQNLCQGERKDYLQGISRRELIRKVGLASMVALPIISSIVVPQAVDAQSVGSCSCPKYSGACFSDETTWGLGCAANRNECMANAAAAAPTFCCPGYSLEGAALVSGTNCCEAFCIRSS